VIKVLFAGEGGQGVQVMAEILAKAAFGEQKASTYIPNFGVEQRGGISLAFVIVNLKPIPYPKFEKADFLAVLSDRAFARVKQYIGPKTKIIFGPAVKTPKFKGLKLNSQGLPAKVWNIFVLAQVNQLGKIVAAESLIKTMDERFSQQFAQNPKLRELDLKALKT